MSSDAKAFSTAGVNGKATLIAGRPLLLMLRMASRDAGIWDGVWNRLCARFSVANFDLSMPTATQLEDPVGVFRRFAHTAADVATGLGFNAFHVLGWTGGTHIALRCAIEFPQRVKSCVLLCPFHELPEMRPFEKGLDIMHAMMACEDRELYAYFWFAAGLSSQFISANFDRVERLAKQRAARDAFVKLDTARMTKWARMLRRNWATDAEMAALKLPILLVAPEIDRWGAGPNVDMARALHARLPNARLEVMQDAGSLILVEDPERFVDLTNTFYRTLS